MTGFAPCLRCRGFITQSRALIALLSRPKKAADISDVNILLEGETGTGKQVLAQAIHKLDQKRGAHNFVTVHCSTITEALAESELFGHTRGAFSGAVQERKGLFQSAQRGTLLLDDVNDLSINLQPKLLDVIQRRRCGRWGQTASKSCSPKNFLERTFRRTSKTSQISMRLSIALQFRMGAKLGSCRAAACSKAQQSQIG